MLEECLLDAREMAPPEPFERATTILRALQPGQYLRMLHRRVPYPLLEFCGGLSLNYSLHSRTEAEYEIIVYFADDEAMLLREGILCE